MKRNVASSSRSGARSGFMLLEALVAVLIFSLGVLGLIALQSKAITQSSQAQYRSSAAQLANDLVNQMTLTDRSNATLSTQFSSSPSGAAYLAWKARVLAQLPGASSTPPTVTVTAINPLPTILGSGTGPADPALTPSSRVTIQLFWKHPAEPAASPANKLQLVSELK
ncbi:type IV pilus modification protein PilV [Inhella proteolytica]|uniref:Type IV pilus modification protein PilV n=1 Tax=Inhella proteolytica TaxID=2795029 RepID=A0A931NFU4_9BURK|nr:type IV pilus modification protein PilV [Inhella proteolytica]MBH9576003.1 type IV pilus modification protein PilV [Inhella proteolytica]